MVFSKRVSSSSSTITIWTLFSPKYPRPRSRPHLSLPCQHLKRPSSSLINKNAVYTAKGLSISRAATTKLSPRWMEIIESESDAISIFNDRIRCDHASKRGASMPLMDSEEADRYIQLVKEQQQRGLEKLKGGGDRDKVGAFSYKVNPYTLRSEDNVVHKKVGVERFVGIKFDVPKDSKEPIEYVFIEYTDGMAKLLVKQASRMLY